MRRWYNNGLCNTARLTAHEKWLRNLYKRVLTLCNKSDAVREGAFFDLMYVNLQQPDFDPHRLFAFVRYTDTEVLLFVVNFDDCPKSLRLNVPDLCYDMAGIAEGDYKVEDLLWKQPHVFTMQRGQQAVLEVGPNDALILPMKKVKPAKNAK